MWASHKFHPDSLSGKFSGLNYQILCLTSHISYLISQVSNLISQITMITSKNPKNTKAWPKLQNHCKNIRVKSLKDLFNQNTKREQEFIFSLENLKVQFANNKIDKETIKLWQELAEEMNLSAAIEQLFQGEKINFTEERAVLHTALRSFEDQDIKVNGLAVYPEVLAMRKKIKAFSDSVINGNWKGYTGKEITDVVNIGIGGSDLGPKMVVEALAHYHNKLNVHFVSNIDGDALSLTLDTLNPETTLFIVVSKTFTTIETLTNARTCRAWFFENADEKSVAKHFVAVSANEKAVSEFGIHPNNIFPMWNWVGGRFSLWSSVGLSIALAVGYENFEQLLKGAEAADLHFRQTTFDKNLPFLMAMLSMWYINFFGVGVEAVIPYYESLNELAAFLQQLFMESNGKSVDRDGNKVDYKTGSVIFGATGTNAQHSFMQHIHQGTFLVPVDFIGFENPYGDNRKQHDILMANFKAQAEALKNGKSASAVHLDMKFNGDEHSIEKLLPYKVFEGNRPSTTFIFDRLNPYNLGMLLALYEHKVFVQGVIWNINSFDQFGVELGKEIAKKLMSEN